MPNKKIDFDKLITFILMGALIVVALAGVWDSFSEPREPVPELSDVIRAELEEQLKPFKETNERMKKWLDEWEVATKEEWELSEESSWEERRVE